MGYLIAWWIRTTTPVRRFICRIWGHHAISDNTPYEMRKYMGWGAYCNRCGITIVWHEPVNGRNHE